jgi:hypothetical protein
MKDEPGRPSFCLSKQSDDHADPAGDYKFKPLVLAEIQTGADSASRVMAECQKRFMIWCMD